MNLLQKLKKPLSYMEEEFITTYQVSEETMPYLIQEEIELIKQTLSPFECFVFDEHYLNGKNLRDLATEEIPIKKLYNTVYSIKMKCKAVLSV